MYRSAKTHNEEPKRQNLHVWSSYRQRGHVTLAIPDAAISAVRWMVLQLNHTSYAVRSVFLATESLLVTVLS